jgi:hypothetical protein
MDLERLFSNYGAALAAGDTNRTAGFYGFPVTMLTDHFVGSLDTPGALHSALAQARETYLQWGITGTTHELLAVESVSDKIARVRVHWRYLGPDGVPLLEPTYEYLIRADGAGPRIHVVVSAGSRSASSSLFELSEVS